MSQRSKRRRGPQRSGGEAAPEGGGRSGEGRQSGGGRSGEGRQTGGRSGEGRQTGGRSGEGRQTGGRSGDGRQTGGGSPAAGAASRRAPSGWGLGVQLAFVVVVFAVVALVAELAGAANLGVALGVGQIAFAIAVIYLLVRR